MIDTVKILLPIHNPYEIALGAFAPYSVKQLIYARGEGRTFLNPPKSYARTGQYMPRLTLHKRPKKGVGILYTLAIEFSAPKMLFQNNFDELKDSDFRPLLNSLQVALRKLLHHEFSVEQLANAKVSIWHPSKNIVFSGYTSCSTILNAIWKLDIPRTYQLNRTDFIEGQAIRIHSNSKELAFYDKLADLRESIKSDKRAVENDNFVQLNLLKEFTNQKNVEVFRYEVRLNGIKAIRRAVPHLEDGSFEEMFSADICKAVLVKEWGKLTQNLDIIGLDTNKPHEILENYIQENTEATPQTILMAVAGLLLIEQIGVRGLRSSIEKRFGVHVWQRLKPLLKSPSLQRYKAFRTIDGALERFDPVNTREYIEDIANNNK